MYNNNTSIYLSRLKLIQSNNKSSILETIIQIGCNLITKTFKLSKLKNSKSSENIAPSTSKKIICVLQKHKIRRFKLIKSKVI